MGILKLPKEFTPGFSTKVKPTVPVVVDKNNYFGAHTIRCFYPTNSATEIIDGYVLPGTSGTSISANKALFDYTAGNKFTFNGPTPVKSAITVIAIVKRNRSTSENGGIYSDKNSSNWSGSEGISLNFRASFSSGLLFKITASDALVDENFVPLGEFATYIATWEASNYQDIYVNGSLRASAGTPAASYTESSIDARMGVYFDESSLRTLDGEIKFLAVLDVGLTQAKVSELTENPYQILKPAIPVSYFVPSAGGATTVPLTGQASTAGQGALTITAGANVSITGQASTSAQGTVNVNIGKTVSLTGQASTAAQGTPTVQADTAVTLTGQESTAQQGTITVSIAGATVVPITGQASTASQGTPTVAGDAVVSLTGQSSTAQQGTVTTETAKIISLTGQSSTASQGPLGITAAVNLSLTGQASTAGQGIITIRDGDTWVVQNNVVTNWVIQ